MLFEQAYDPVRCLHAAWALLKRAPATVVLGALIPLVIQYAMAFGLQFLMLPLMLSAEQPRAGEVPWFFPAFFVVAIVLSLFQLAFQSWIDVGYARAVREVQATEGESFATIFRGSDRLVALLLARFLVFLLYLVVYLLAAGALLVLGVLGSTSTPGLVTLAAVLGVLFVLWCAMAYVLLGLQFVTPIVAFENCSATQAIGRSWRLADGRRWRLIVFWLFLMLIGFAGVLTCGVGLLLAWPLIETMRIEAYLTLKQPIASAPVEPQGWGSAPPPLAPRAS